MTERDLTTDETPAQIVADLISQLVAFTGKLDELLSIVDRLGDLTAAEDMDAPVLEVLDSTISQLRHIKRTI